MTQEPQVLKRDARGRVRVPAERREALLDEFDRSGLSGVKFARLAGINYATFANWVQKRRKERACSTVSAIAQAGSAPASGPVRLFEAYVPAAAPGWRAVAGCAGLVVELPGGGRMQVESPMQLRLAAELLGLMAEGARRPC